MINFSKFKVPFIGTSGVVFNGLLQNLFSFFDFIILFKDTGVTHDNSFVERVLIVGEGIEVLGLIEVEFLELFLSHLEELLERETFNGFALLFVHLRICLR